MALQGSCHCGAVQVEIPHAPETLTNCNYSICRRYGGLWAYFPETQVRIKLFAAADTWKTVG